MTKKGENRGWLRSTTQVLVRKEDVKAAKESAQYWKDMAERHRTTSMECLARADGIAEALDQLGLL